MFFQVSSDGAQGTDFYIRVSAHEFLHASFGNRISGCEPRSANSKARIPLRRVLRAGSPIVFRVCRAHSVCARMAQCSLACLSISRGCSHLVPSRAKPSRVEKSAPPPRIAPPFRTVFATQSKRFMTRLRREHGSERGGNSGGRGSLFDAGWFGT